jgi:hypothetical protein
MVIHMTGYQLGEHAASKPLIALPRVDIDQKELPDGALACGKRQSREWL